MICAKGILRKFRSIASTKLRENDGPAIVHEEGAALIEMALSCFILLSALFGLPSAFIPSFPKLPWVIHKGNEPICECTRFHLLR